MPLPDDLVTAARLELANRDFVRKLVEMMRVWNCRLMSDSPAGLERIVDEHAADVVRIATEPLPQPLPRPPRPPTGARPTTPPTGTPAPAGYFGPVLEVDARPNASEPDQPPSSPTSPPPPGAPKVSWDEPTPPRGTYGRRTRGTSPGMGATVPVPRPPLPPDDDD